MPRRTRLTPEVSKALCDAVRDGCFLSHAASIVGVSAATVHEWIRRGEGNDDRSAVEPYATFATAVRQARAEAEFEMVGVINRAAEDGQWRAAAWWLERSNPEAWGPGARRMQVRDRRGRYSPAGGESGMAIVAALAERMARNG